MVPAEAFGSGFVVADYACFFVAAQLLIHKHSYGCGREGFKSKRYLE